MPWTVLVPHSTFLGEPCQLVECATCGGHRRYVPAGRLPTRCPACGSTGATPVDATPVDATPVDATPAKVPPGALTAGVCRVA